jgi:hypothetical protein
MREFGERRRRRGKFKGNEMGGESDGEKDWGRTRDREIERRRVWMLLIVTVNSRQVGYGGHGRTVDIRWPGGELKG